VEFGAADGIYISNTYNLFKQGWKGLYIEGNEKYIDSLNENFPEGCGALVSNEFVIWKESQKGMGRYFDDIADEFLGDKEIDFLSIDIDGGDYYIFKGLKRRPKVLCLEVGYAYHPLFAKELPESKVMRNLGQSYRLFVEQGYKMGYTPVALNLINLFLVRNDFIHHFDDVDKDPITLFKNSYEINTYHGYRAKFHKQRRRRHIPIEDKDYDSIMPIMK